MKRTIENQEDLPQQKVQKVEEDQQIVSNLTRTKEAHYTFAGKPREELKEDSFINKLNLASFDCMKKLDEEGRGVCPECKGKRKFYCYDCVVPLNQDPTELPRLKLPVDVTVVRHPKEKRSKSSIISSRIIAPDNIEILHTVEVPEQQTEAYGDEYGSVVLMFPADEASEVTAMTREELQKIKKVVLIDSTWSQTRYYLRQDTVKKLKTVKIKTEKTVFWRYQKGEADTSLSTVEALYFFFRDYETTLNCNSSYEQYTKNGGIWDNLLYYYCWNFQLIQESYKTGKNKDMPFRRIPGYVQYGEEDASVKRKQDLHSGEWADWKNKKKEKQPQQEVKAAAQQLVEVKANTMKFKFAAVISDNTDLLNLIYCLAFGHELTALYIDADSQYMKQSFVHKCPVHSFSRQNLDGFYAAIQNSKDFQAISLPHFDINVCVKSNLVSLNYVLGLPNPYEILDHYLYKVGGNTFQVNLPIFTKQFPLLAEKSKEQMLEDERFMQSLRDRYSVIKLDHLKLMEREEKECEIRTTFKQGGRKSGQKSLLQKKITLSATILDPEAQPAQMSQKEQLFKIMEHLKQTELIPYVVKVGLFIPDLSEFKALNADYCQYFGEKPPVRVCVQIPGNEIIAYFVIYNQENEVQLANIKENLHIQCVNTIVCPNVGPYSQMNKLQNILFMAGNIGLYPPNMCLIHPEDVVLQYKQIKCNYNAVLRKSLHSDHVIWQQVTKSALIFIAERTDISLLMPHLRRNFGFIASHSVVLRVAKLPMNCLVEIELLGDSAGPQDAHAPLPFSVRQKLYAADDLKQFHGETQPNTQGEIFYTQDQISKSEITKKTRLKTEIEHVSIIPVLEIIPIVPQVTTPIIVERFYKM